MKRKPGPPCPHRGTPLAPEEVRSIWGAYSGKLQSPHAGPGPPRSASRCPCGAMTKARARQRNHECEKGTQIAPPCDDIGTQLPRP